MDPGETQHLLPDKLAAELGVNLDEPAADADLPKPRPSAEGQP
ncbi:hypothetical protein AB0E69_11600 [Kribbella sp. NPDC026611]